MIDSKKKIERALRKTLSDPTKWGNVLDVLIQETGSKKGIILQREVNTGMLLLPKNLPEELSKPLLRGFTEHQMMDYESHYAESDPWTEIELRFLSTEPYALSSYLPINELKKHPLYEWLEPQKITDTVVMDIYRDGDYWVAVNLFFDVNDSGVRKRCIDLLSENKTILQTAWHALIKSYTLPDVSQPMAFFLERSDKAEIIINATGRVLAFSEQVKNVLKENDFPIIIKSGKIFIRNKLLSEKFIFILQGSFERGEETKSFQLGEYNFNLTNINNHVDIVGKDHGLKLLSFNGVCSKKLGNAPIWESDVLTKREKDLVKVLAQGGRVVDFQKKYNLAKSTAHNCWSKVKGKLNISDRSQLFGGKINRFPPDKIEDMDR
ncbi:hypothetical protein L3I75_000488 [Vibrio vulnificus]|uniref:hypothetical protein n=1 Tax=Vibrio vulnificus TaxID=672 RepID=UPI00130286F3|nr:hypothetical protein [Vibrio vulnificus]EIU7611518.1 hypothetical protein [Vibrio vulnificus]EIU7861414.1 hypothetical protein [Vibrio vulnificus]EJE8577720.1 hypothetical protein [Vibrio vulnificus]MCU8204271.1 hypothetical protein [Vibrio vulnificus]HAS8421479.1 hypothetical protein [Vibrio vulnificus]